MGDRRHRRLAIFLRCILPLYLRTAYRGFGPSIPRKCAYIRAGRWFSNLRDKVAIMPPVSDSNSPTFVELLGRRRSPRLHLSVPAKLISVYETQNCTLLDISQTGARLALERPLGVETSGYLRVGPIEVFATAVRMRMSDEGVGINGVEFDVRLSKPQVLAVRAYAENYEMAERRAFLMHARDWVMGGA